ncbi:MAG: HU family DNA-binding protein [bacterium]
MPLIKVDIVKEVARILNMKDKDALVVVDSIIDSMEKIIVEHGRLEIRDFGVFQIKERKKRTGRNPRNKKEYPIPARKVVTFKLGKELKDRSILSMEAATRLDPSAQPASEQADGTFGSKKN